uniref:Uncharacterized protein n=1 Tax=Amphimedon queenslandica TaxID=400682 RepID=A0A1X7SX37_AMPQE
GKLIFDDSDDDYDEHLLSSSNGNDSSILNSSGIDSDLEEFIISSVKCTCSIEKSSHQRSCPLNLRNRGWAAIYSTSSMWCCLSQAWADPCENRGSGTSCIPDLFQLLWLRVELQLL